MFYFTGCCLVVSGTVPFITALLCRSKFVDLVNKEKNVLGDLDRDLGPEPQNPSECNRLPSVA